jgi:hypothetical protein
MPLLQHWQWCQLTSQDVHNRIQCVGKERRTGGPVVYKRAPHHIKGASHHRTCAEATEQSWAAVHTCNLPSVKLVSLLLGLVAKLPMCHGPPSPPSSPPLCTLQGRAAALVPQVHRHHPTQTRPGCDGDLHGGGGSRKGGRDQGSTSRHALPCLLASGPEVLACQQLCSLVWNV